MPGILKIFFISMLPIFELRGAIPVGVAMNYGYLYVFIAAYLGSLIPSVIIYYGSKPIFKWLRTTRIFRKLVDDISLRTLKKGKNIKKYGFWGLLLFVAIPLPGTGVWTGSLAASLLNMKYRISFVAIAIGNFIAGCILLTISFIAVYINQYAYLL